MTSRPTRDTAAGRTYLDLQNLARRQGRPTDELFQLFALEALLARLAESDHAGQFVLKGGVLLAAFDSRRPTRDIDMHAIAIANDAATVRNLITEIAGLELDDGIVFHTANATADIIRDQDEYSGVRVTLTATVARAQISLHVDVNVGDPIHPGPERVALPRLLGGEIELTGYPITMVLAAKIVTAIQRGTANTRWRDFADIYILTRRHTVDAANLRASLHTVAEYRRAALEPLDDTLDGYAEIAQPQWLGWRRRQHLETGYPNRSLPCSTT